MQSTLIVVTLLFILNLVNVAPVVSDADRRDISCSSITVQYSGTFQNPTNVAQTFDARFQFKLTSSILEHRIHFESQHWDQRLANGSEFTYWMSVYTGDYFPVINYTNSVRFDGWDTAGRVITRPLYIHIDHAAGVSYDKYFRIYYQKDFNMLFTLQKAVGQCTDAVITTDPHPDSALYHACACCGDYNPDPLLVCPSPWSHTDSK